MITAARQGIEDNSLRNLEEIIVLSKPAKQRLLEKDFSFSDSLFIEYFCPHMSIKQIEEAVEKKADLFTLAAMDYYRRFGGSAEKSSSLTGLKPEDIIGYFTEILIKKNPEKYKRDAQRQFAATTVDSGIISSIYLNIVKNGARELIGKASNLDDLKAILLIEKIVPLLRHNKVYDMFASGHNPEQTFIELIKIVNEEKQIQDIDDYIKKINDISEEADKLMRDDLTEESANKILTLKRAAEKASKKAFYKFNNGNYANIRSLLQKRQETIDAINMYIHGQTAVLFESIEPEFEPSNSWAADLKKSRSNAELFEAVKAHYRWFNSELPEKEDIQSKINERHRYLTKVNDAAKRMEEMMGKIAEYAREIRDAGEKISDEGAAKRMLAIRQDIEEHLDDFKEWNEDNYLKGLCKTVNIACRRQFSAADNKINNLLGEAYEKLISIEPDKGLVYDIEKDDEKNKSELAKLNEVRAVYKWFDEACSQLDELEARIKEKEQSLATARDVQSRLRERYKKLEDYSNELFEISHINKDSAARLLEIKKDADENSEEFREWTQDPYLSDEVRKVLGLSTYISMDIDSKISSKIQEANAIFGTATSYELTGRLEEDEKKTCQDMIRIRAAAEVYSWFGVKEKEAKADEEKLRQRQKYFSKARSALKEMDSIKKEAGVYFTECNILNFGNITTDDAKTLAAKKAEFREMMAKLAPWENDVYTRDSFPGFKVVAEIVEKGIDYKINQLTGQIKNAVNDAGLRFESSGDIEQDCLTAKNKKEICEKAEAIGRIIGADVEDIGDKIKLISDSFNRHKSFKERWDAIKRSIPFIEDYESKMKIILTGMISHNSVSSINMMIRDLRKNREKYKSYSEDPAFMSYRCAAEHVRSASLALDRAMPLISEYLSTTLKALSGSAKRTIKDTLLYYGRSGEMKKILRTGQRPPYLEKKCGEITKYKMELYNLQKINYPGCRDWYDEGIRETIWEISDFFESIKPKPKSRFWRKLGKAAAYLTAAGIIGLGGYAAYNKNDRVRNFIDDCCSKGNECVSFVYEKGREFIGF
jgi:hypothetical protein